MLASSTRSRNAPLQLSSSSCGFRSSKDSHIDDISHDTFSSSLTSLETSDSDTIGTHSRNEERRTRHFSPATSCRSLFSDNLETFDPSAEPCRSLVKYIHIMCGNEEPYTSEWHKSTTRGLEDCSTDTCNPDGIHYDLCRSTQRISFPLSNMRTECTADVIDTDDMSRSQSPISELEPSHHLFRRLAQHAYAELLDIQSDTTSSNSTWSSESFASDINLQWESETNSDLLATPGHPLPSRDAHDSIHITTSGFDIKSPDFDIPFLLPHPKMLAIQVKRSLSHSRDSVDNQFLVDDIWDI